MAWTSTALKNLAIEKKTRSVYKSGLHIFCLFVGGLAKISLFYILKVILLPIPEPTVYKTHLSIKLIVHDYQCLFFTMCTVCVCKEDYTSPTCEFLVFCVPCCLWFWTSSAALLLSKPGNLVIINGPSFHFLL